MSRRILRETTFRYPNNVVTCFGCGKNMSPIRGCPDRIEICPVCRKNPKVLEGARGEMNAHMLSAHGSVP